MCSSCKHKCRNCGEPIEQDLYYNDWLHENGEPHCKDSKPALPLEDKDG